MSERLGRPIIKFLLLCVDFSYFTGCSYYDYSYKKSFYRNAELQERQNDSHRPAQISSGEKYILYYSRWGDEEYFPPFLSRTDTGVSEAIIVVLDNLHEGDRYSMEKLGENVRYYIWANMRGYLNTSNYKKEGSIEITSVGKENVTAELDLLITDPEDEYHPEVLDLNERIHFTKEPVPDNSEQD